MQWVVRAAVVSGLMALSVPPDKIDACWERWLTIYKDVDFEGAPALDLYKSIVDAAKAAE